MKEFVVGDGLVGDWVRGLGPLVQQTGSPSGLPIGRIRRDTICGLSVPRSTLAAERQAEMIQGTCYLAPHPQQLFL